MAHHRLKATALGAIAGFTIAACGGAGQGQGTTGSASPTGTSANTGSGTPNETVGQSAAECHAEKFETGPVFANMQIILDHSGSMKELSASGNTKWSAAVTAINSMTHANQGPIRFGLSTFSDPNQVCFAGKVLVQIGDQTADAIANALPDQADGNKTPLGAAIAKGKQSPGLTDTTRANFLMAITDGKENCGGRPVGEVRKAFESGLRTFVVGFGKEIDPQMLNAMAVSGGTARMGSQRYYQADTQDDILNAVKSIAAGATRCDFTLSKAPVEIDKLFVAVEGQFVPRDTKKIAGWEYNAATQRVTLYGPPCDAMANIPNAKVSVMFGCPDYDFVETGNPGARPDGGFDWKVDDTCATTGNCGGGGGGATDGGVIYL